jgi:hypothetical protein
MTNDDLVRKLEESGYSDGSADSIYAYKNGGVEPSVAVKKAIAKATGKTVSYFEQMGSLAILLGSGADRESVLFAAGIVFSAASRSMDTEQLSTSIMTRGGVSLKTAQGITKQILAGSVTTKAAREHAARAFGIPVNNIEWIGHRVLEPESD